MSDSFESASATFTKAIAEHQERISAEMRRLDPSIRLREERWSRRDANGDEGGGGRTRAFEGELFENAGVNISEVYGALPQAFSRQLGGDESDRLWAAGLSLIIHPRNPHVPSVHANFRLIRLGARSWFGGGSDLTPYYPHVEDFRAFHRVWADACAPYGCYDEMKAQCDAYFVNHHRDGEMRGIGGIFFDHWNSGDLASDLAMTLSLAARFVPSYFPIVERRASEPYSAEDEQFQLWRRGRYVEFNLLHDRGTKFGLQSNGRTESILISLPARCRFAYDYQPPAGTPYAEMMRYYRPHAWAGESKAD